MLLTGKLLEGLVAVPVGGGRARAGRRPPARTAARLHRFGGRRRDRRARAGFETRHRAKRGCLVSRAAGASGAWKTRGAKSNMRNHAGPPPTGTHSGQVGRGGPCGMHSAQVRRGGPAVCRAAGPCGTNSSRALVSRRSADPGIRRRTRGRRWPPRPRPSWCLPRSCEAGRRWTWPRRPMRRRGRAS